MKGIKDGANNKRFWIWFLLCLIVRLVFVPGEIKFDSPRLNSQIVEGDHTVGRRSFKIEKGKLILTSDNVGSGVSLYNN